MTEEEKKAIENLKEINQAIKYRPMFSIPSDTKLFDTILNLIEKQQKEIEELEEDNKHQLEERCKLTFELENSTSKDKIKAKIEEYEKEIQIRKNVINNDVLDKQTIEKARIEWACMEDFIYEMQSLLEKE